MKEFVDNLISRLEEKIFSAELHDCGWEGQTAHNLLTLGDVRDAAEQLAEEYKKEWSKDYGWKLTKRFIEEKYFKRIYEISEKYDYPCENIALDMNWMFGLIEKIENKFTEEYKPRTNADKVRNMNETQLSNLISSACPYECCDHYEDTTCDLCILEWLQSEVKDGE